MKVPPIKEGNVTFGTEVNFGTKKIKKVDPLYLKIAQQEYETMGKPAYDIKFMIAFDKFILSKLKFLKENKLIERMKELLK